MLLFKAHLLPLIRSGQKRQTIRLWKAPRVRPGQLAFAPGLGKLLITAVDTLPSLAALTRADARADGFPTKKALLAEIHRLYNPMPKDRQIYRIQFHYPTPKNPSLAPALSHHLLPTPNLALSPTPVRPPRVPNQKSKLKNQKSPIPLPQRRQTLRHFLVALAPRVTSASR